MYFAVVVELSLLSEHDWVGLTPRMTACEDWLNLHCTSCSVEADLSEEYSPLLVLVPVETSPFGFTT